LIRQTEPSDQQRALAEQTIVKILTCPSADHSLDPTPFSATNTSGTGYWGDYTYNQNLGCYDYSSSTPTTESNYTPFEKFNEVPGNVVVMTDIDKTWAEANGTSETNLSIFLEPNYLLGNHSTWPASPPNMWVPHNKGTQANMLFIDGHISLVSPNDFIMPGSGGHINTSTVPWTYTPSPSGIQTKNWIVGYYKAGNNPPWVVPWNKFAPGL
jgi:prepilin-type processing-associated H-X9-DG protein